MKSFRYTEADTFDERMMNLAVRRIIKEQPTISLESKQATSDKTSNWVPVSEMLPDGKEDSYLVTRTDGKYTWVEEGDFVVDEFFFIGDEYRFNLKRRIENVAWMPLPEPYEGDENSCIFCNNHDGSDD